MYFCITILKVMDTIEPVNNKPIKPKAPKKSLFFFIGMGIGLMIGMVLTMIIINLVDIHRPSVVSVLNPEPVQYVADTPDTVTRIVVKNKPEITDNDDEEYYAQRDTVMTDSIYAEDVSQDLMLDETEIQESQNQLPPEHIVSAKLLHTNTVKVLFLNENKTETTPPDKAIAEVHIQQWETPIKNKLSYFLSDNSLKIKGLNIEHLKIIHYKNCYYLVNGNHFYAIHQNKQYERLVETHNLIL